MKVGLWWIVKACATFVVVLAWWVAMSALGAIGSMPSDVALMVSGLGIVVATGITLLVMRWLWVKEWKQCADWLSSLS